MADATFPLSFLHLERNDRDAAQVAASLAQAGVSARLLRARTRAEFLHLLDRCPDLILAEAQQPDFDGSAALAAARAKCPNIPFILLSDEAGAEVAIDALHGGATDYVLKQRLGRLTPAVRRALAKSQERDRGRQAEEERQRLEAELQRRVAELDETARRKDEFLAILAHELRNPLAPIRSAIDVLCYLRSGDPHQDRARDIIGRQVAHLSRLVDDLLDINRITQGKIELRRVPTDLVEVVRQALETSRPLIDARGHTLDLELSPTPVPVLGDATRLAQAVANLLNNAAKYMRDGGRIGVAVRPEAGQAMVRVRDTGLGIPADMLPRVFDLFTQLSPTLDHASGGLGIGLTLVRGLVELHSGRVEAFSDGIDRGSEFVVRLPLSAAPLPSAAPERERDDQGPHRRVLIVDDLRDNRETLALLLRAHGHTVEVARDGPSALEMARSFRPTVILMDVGLPGMNGYDVCRRLRQEPHLRSVLIAAMTGYARPEDRQRSLDAGMNLHLTKPVGWDDLATLLARPESDGTTLGRDPSAHDGAPT